MPTQRWSINLQYFLPPKIINIFINPTPYNLQSKSGRWQLDKIIKTPYLNHFVSVFVVSTVGIVVLKHKKYNGMSITKCNNFIRHNWNDSHTSKVFINLRGRWNFHTSIVVEHFKNVINIRDGNPESAVFS